MRNTLTYEAFRQRGRFPALDGVRALAILGVLAHHTRNNPFARLHGYRGVWIFFVLSGFLITTLALREESSQGRLDLRAFLIRRVFRIMPLYYLVLLIFVVWVCVFGMEPNGDLLQHHFPSFLLYVSEFPIFLSNFQIPFGQSWSLGIEEKFYLAWPIVGFWLLARSPHRLPVTVALLSVTALLTVTTQVFAQMWGSYTDILIGCLLAQLLHDRATYPTLARLGQPTVAWIAWGILAFATLSGGMGTQIGECLYALLAAVALVTAVTSERGPAALLASSWLVRIGTWSYAIYLIHPIVIDAVGRVLPPGRAEDYLTLPVMLLIALPVCAWLHVHVEKPLISVGRRWVAKRPTPVLEPT